MGHVMEPTTALEFAQVQIMELAVVMARITILEHVMELTIIQAIDDMQPEHCKNCKWFPVCLGPCNRQLIAHQGEKICTFDASSLTQKEFLMYLFKYNLLKNEIYNEP